MRKKIVINLIFSILLAVIFIIVICWTTNFKLINFQNIRILIVIITSTSILLLIGETTILDFNKLLIKFKFNLFFVGNLISLFLMFNYFNTTTNYNNLFSNIVFCLKPLLFCLLIYLPAINVLEKIKYNYNKNNQIESLSRREEEVFKLIIQGQSNKEISLNLYIAESTVKKHVQSILKKSVCNNREELIKKLKLK